MNPSPMASAHERESALFALALEKPLTERSVFLHAVCGKDNVLRQRLEALFAAHDQPDNLVPTQAEAVGLREVDTKQVVARFEAERQALAMMDHPNIAKAGKELRCPTPRRGHELIT